MLRSALYHQDGRIESRTERWHLKLTLRRMSRAGATPLCRPPCRGEHGHDLHCVCPDASFPSILLPPVATCVHWGDARRPTQLLPDTACCTRNALPCSATYARTICHCTYKTCSSHQMRPAVPKSKDATPKTSGEEGRTWLHVRPVLCAV